ncbi:MAG: PorV/PorQ family protein [Bacteroidia bacterium]
MIKNLDKTIKLLLAGSILAGTVHAGNPERAGQAGASQLLIDPYARNSGWAGSNQSTARGIEAQFLNVAGTAFTRKTEVDFSRTNWLVGTGIYMNTFGMTQHVGETGAIGIGIVSLNAGKIDITTEDQPEGGLGTFNPTFYNINLSYAKGFSDNIYGGINVKVISEQIANVSARGVAIDAGIQYQTGKYDQIHFGISLKNLGPKMQYKGDGLTFQGNSHGNGAANYQLTVSNRSASFELPSLINIGGAYDFYLTKDTSGLLKTHRVTFAANFTSNSFSYDNYLFGLEYAWKNMLMIRAGLYTEKYIFKKGNDDLTQQRMTAFTGPSVGATFEIPFGEKKSTFGVDYSYRFTNPFGGVHQFGFRINL